MLRRCLLATLFAMITLCLVSCVQQVKSNQEIVDEEIKIDHFNYKYATNRNLYFAIVRQHNTADWKLIKISKSILPVDIDQKEERIVFDLNSQQISPALDEEDFWVRPQISKGAIYLCGGVTYVKPYNPCSSRLLRKHRSVDGALGFKKVLDKNVINKVIEDTNLIQNFYAYNERNSKTKKFAIEIRNKYELVYKRCIEDLQKKRNFLFNKVVTKYKIYKSDNIKLNHKIVDRSGFYKNEIDFSNYIEVKEQQINNNDFNINFKSFDESYKHSLNMLSSLEGDNLFGDELNKSKLFIEKQFEIDSGNLEINKKIFLNKYFLDLKKATSSYPIIFSNVQYINNFEVKIDAPEEVPFKKEGSQTVNVNITIFSKEFSVNLPAFQNYDNNLDISTDSSQIEIKNKTKQFIEIAAISMYYNEKIYTSNAIVDLPPRSSKKVPIRLVLGLPGMLEGNAPWDRIRTTKSQAQSTKFEYGYAIKYHKENMQQNKTCYATKNFSLIDQLKSK